MIPNILPTEILLEVFSNLPYWDLKLSIPLVCRRFRQVVGASVHEQASSPAVNRILFKDRPPPPISPSPPVIASKPWFDDRRIYLPTVYRWEHESEEYKLHPVFKMLHYACTSSMDDVRILPDKNGIEFITGDNGDTAILPRLTSFSVADENATVPAVGSLVFGVKCFAPTIIRGADDGPVTVRDVMQAVLDVANTRVPASHPIFSLLAVWTPMVRLQPMSFWDSWNPRAWEAMADICGWEGIARVMVLEGAVHLFAELMVISQWRPTPEDPAPTVPAMPEWLVREPFGEAERILRDD